MIEDFARLTGKAAAAIHWAFYAALAQHQGAIEPAHLLNGIQTANPQMFADVDCKRIGISPVDVSDVPRIQQEMQKLYMEASLQLAKEGHSGTPAVSARFSQNSRQALEIATKHADSFGAKNIGTPHLVFGICKVDPDLAVKLAQAGMGEDRILSFCRDYKEGHEGESMSQTIEKIRGRAFRSGIGYDLHRLEAGRKLIIGGVELPFDRGPAGHSDGDVLAHAMCDALLGAAGLGDIGTHFPDTDPKWKGANSLLFLEHAKKLLDEQHFVIEWIDAVVITEKPKLGPHFPKMREALARALGVSADHIHLKAKTNEGVDAIGRGEAIAAHVVATLSKQ